MKNHRSRISRMVAIALTAVMMVTGIDMPVYAVETDIKAGLAASEIFFGEDMGDTPEMHADEQITPADIGEEIDDQEADVFEEEVKLLSENNTPESPGPETAASGDWYYSIDSYGLVTITKYVGSGGHVVIPSTMEGKSVRFIQNNAFKDCTKLTSVVIPNEGGVIASGVFSGCTGLTDVIFSGPANPSSGAFSGCTNLKTVSFASKVEIYSIRNAFTGCDAITTVNITPDTDWDSIKGQFPDGAKSNAGYFVVLMTEPAGAGTISVSDNLEEVSKGIYRYSGTGRISATANPNEYYEFEGWMRGGSSILDTRVTTEDLPNPGMICLWTAHFKQVKGLRFGNGKAHIQTSFVYGGSFHEPSVGVYDAATLSKLGNSHINNPFYTLTFERKTGDDSWEAIDESDIHDAGTYRFVAIGKHNEEEGGIYNYEGCTATLEFTIAPRPVRLCAKDAEFVYNGKPQSEPGYYILKYTEDEETGLVGEDAISVKNKGSITFPSQSPITNEIESYTFTKGNPDNYKVYSDPGKLTMSAASQPITITVISDGSKTYDGKPLTAKGATITSGELFPGDELVASVKGSATNVTDTIEGNSIIEECRIMHGDQDVTENYVITKVPGTLTIKPKAVTITVQDKVFTYDGYVHSWPHYDVTGLVGTDSIEVTVTGSITNADESPVANVIESYEFTSGIPSNYTVTTKNGQLTIAACNSHTYDSGVVTKVPTTTEEGVKTFTCVRCGHSYTEAIPKLSGDLLLYEKIQGNYVLQVSRKLRIGGSFSLVPKFADGKVLNQRVVWSSSKPNVATVTQDGKVIGLSGGETVITAMSEETPSLSAYCHVSVTEPVTEITLDKKNYSFGAGETTVLTATVLPSTAIQELKWTTDSENVDIAVSKDTLSATVTGKVAGKAKVTATAADGSGKKATCSFTIGTAVPDFSIAGKNNVSTVEAGKTLNMIVNWGDTKPSNTGVTWELKGSNANYIASITDNGVLTGITAGKVTVTATSTANPNKKASTDITVTKPAESKKAKVTGIGFTNTDNLVKKGLNAGKSYTIKTKLTLSGKGSADSNAVAWVTSDPTVATVNQKGAVKAVAPGMVTVTAIARDAADISTAPKATVTFTVYSIVKSVKLDKKKLTIGTQAGTQYGKVSIASIVPAFATNPSFDWTVNNKNVALAAIPKDGYPSSGNFASADSRITTKAGEAVAIMALAPGTVKLTGITKDGSKKKVTCTITVRGKVTGFSLKTQAAKNGLNDVTQGIVSGNNVTYTSTMKEGGSLKLTPVFEINGVANTQSTKKTYNTYRKYTDLSVSYRSSDTMVATVDKNGKIKIQKKAASGKTATIYGVTADGQRSVEVFVTVK